MFTGIIETMGRVDAIHKQGSNMDIWVNSNLAPELKIDQSLAHNGVCLTVVEIKGEKYRVTAIDETLYRSNLGRLKQGDYVNLERCMRAGDRFDGHMVQGHVDTTARVINVEQIDGSWNVYFQLEKEHQGLLVEKGSITMNGISLTVVDVKPEEFSVSIIPYTYEHTNIRYFEVGTVVNIEYDILGKYVQAALNQRSIAGQH